MPTIFITGAWSGIGKAAARLFAEKCWVVIANQRKFLLDGTAELPGSEEAVEAISRAATDGKDIIDYPTDSVCARLYAKYEEMGLEKFKDYFYRLVFEN